MTVEVRICQPFKTPIKQSVRAAARTWAHGKRRGFSPAASAPLGLTFRSTHFFSCLHNVRADKNFLQKRKTKFLKKSALARTRNFLQDQCLISSIHICSRFRAAPFFLDSFFLIWKLAACSSSENPFREIVGFLIWLHEDAFRH